MPSPFIEVPVGPRLVKVTNPDKVYFPEQGATKLDLVRYYLSVGEGILRALDRRPTYLKRHPDGVHTDAIYQKRFPAKRPDWIETVEVTFPSGRHADALCVTELADVAYCANLGTIDFHPLPLRRGDSEHPDELRVDLDPHGTAGYAEAVRVAQVVREIADELGYVMYPKTSGSHGVHVYLRVEPRWSFVELRRAGIALLREVERRAPDLATTAWWKEERGDRVFMDYNQNARDRTVASAYSVRARPMATVSTPLTWDELPDTDPNDLTVVTVPKRFAELGDVHAGIDDRAFSLEPLLEMSARDERDHGLGDLPYPPSYPKMPGEPPRVQPSKKNPQNWENTAPAE
ncbi:MAG: ATP-dependent DNA ligase [Streptosporangiales bacterium]|nr:ATP-dependent DNA ligase [Streptosporangiales bacterium]